MQLTVTTENARKNFYPTPLELGKRLLEGIELRKIHTILEPSAGKGNLLTAMCYMMKQQKEEFYAEHFFRGYRCNLEIDLVEIDPSLRGMLRETFIDTDYYQLMRDLEKIDEPTDAEAERKDYFRMMDDFKDNSHVKFVEEDFLRYQPFTHYDLIVMNPPFDAGDSHLMHAIKMQERFGGMIRCILNAETLRNPYSNQRKALAKKLSDLNAEIEFVEDAFTDAERKTNVEIAIIKIDIPPKEEKSRIYEHFKEAEMHTEHQHTPKDVISTNPIEAILAQYRVEVNSGIALIEEYNAMKPYILNTLDTSRKYASPILELTCNTSGCSINDYVKRVRQKYWNALFRNNEIFGHLTSNLYDELYSIINKMDEYEFSLYNIQLLISQMNAKLADGIVEAILKLFDELTVKFNWRNDPTYDDNIHYFNGWASNKAHKINRKVILPCNGIFPDPKWYKHFIDTRYAYSFLSDIEKALNYLDGNMTLPVNLEYVLDVANNNHSAKNIHCKFFDVTFYKKGTAHITFTNLELLDRFNIFCCRGKNWLPPAYGKKPYQQMDVEEKSVIDSFHGDGTEGSGETEYEKVLLNSQYYLSSPTNSEVGFKTLTA